MSKNVITIERYTLLSRWGSTWSYVYTVDGRRCQYGPGMTDMMSMLKRKFKGYEIVKEWVA